MHNKIYTIQQAAEKLHLSAKTLRRWEAKGILQPGRTPGNQRRYTARDIQRLRRRKKYQAGFVAKDVVFFISGCLVGLVCLVSVAVLVSGSGAKNQIAPQRTERSGDQAVLGIQKRAPQNVFRINIPSVFSSKARFLSGVEIQKGLTVAGIATLSGGIRTNNQNIDAGTGNITAANILYNIRAGQNIAISGGQNPIISATGGVSSLQGLTGAVSLVAGSDISIAGLTITDKATLASVYARGGCSGCLTDADVGNTLTISADGSVNAAAIKTGAVSATNGGTGLTSFQAGDLLYAGSTNPTALARLGIGTAGQLLTISGGLPVWTSNPDPPASGTFGYFQRNAGALSPTNLGDDLLLGGSATNAAKFGFLNVSSGTPTASISAGATGLALAGDGTIQSLRNGTLTIGGNATGNITLSPRNGSGIVTATGSFTLSTGKTYQIAQTDVLSATSLGSGVTSSSLTTVGALSSGSIASGFGTITTANTITGTTLNGTTGINTGAAGGTQRIDSSGNLVNIGTTQFNSLTYTWPGSGQSAGYALVTNGSGMLSWADLGNSISNYWRQANGAVYSANNTVDLLIGGTSSTSAKFAVLNVAGGTPTASVSAGTNGGAYLTADGILATTAKQSLTLGGGGTGNIVLAGFGSGVLHSNTAGVLSSSVVTNNELQNSSVTINTGTGLSGGGAVALGGTLSLTNTGVTSLTGTANQVSVSGSTGSVTLSLPQDIHSGATPTFAGLTLSGFTTDKGLLYTNGSGVLSQTAQGAAGTVLHGNGTGAPSFSAVSLTADVTGILPIGNGGTNITSYTTGDLLYASNTNILSKLPIGGAGAVLSVSGGLPSWAAASNINFWQRTNGALAPLNITDDLLLGATATTSAKFGFLNVAGGTPTASISANSGNNATFLTGTGILGTTNAQTLTLGGSTTGNILINPRNGAAGGYFAPVSDNVTDLGSSPSARFRNLFLGPGSLHVQCTTGDGCGQNLDYELGVVSSGTGKNSFIIGANGNSGNRNSYLAINEGGNVGIGLTNPGTKLDLPQNTAIRVGNANLSSGGDYVNLSTHEWYNGSSWVSDGTIGTLYQQTGQAFNWYKHNGAGTHTTLMGLDSSGNLSTTGYVSITGSQNASGNLRFSAANPYISASSYFIAPGGAYFNSGTVYTEAAIQARGGIHNDTNSYLTVSGGTSGYTYFSGNVGIGTSTPGNKFEVNGNVYITSTLQALSTITTNNLFVEAGIVSTGGSSLCYTPTAIIGACASDARLKENIRYIDTGGLDIVRGLKPALFDWINGSGTNEPGFIAQDVMQVAPWTVRTGRDGYYALTPQSVLPYAVLAIKELDSKLTVQAQQTNNLATNLDAVIATQSAFTPDLSNKYSSQSGVLSLSTQVATNSNKIASLTNQVSNLSDMVNLLASESANLAASGSGQFMNIDSLDLKDATVSKTLQVLGKTTLSDLGVTGTITAGNLSIHGLESEINSIGHPLKLQSYATDGIDILNGKVTIDTAGNIKTEGDITAKSIDVEKVTIRTPDDVKAASVGEATIPAGQATVIIKTTAVTDMSKVFVTSKADIDVPLNVVSSLTGQSFTVKISRPQDKGVKFNWWVIN